MALTPDIVQLLSDTRTVDFTTIGRRSGQPRTVEIWWFHHDGRFVITGTPGRRDWLANVRADARVEVSTPYGVFSGIATEVTDDSWKQGFFGASASSWYRTQAQLDDLVATAPMIEITALTTAA
ncbi:MAG: nitroreductase family deazaflavin-dependent oxidoreductase [Acidimicrobiia bacterium]|nr:nitroreductase family deazaflavin-dependent oxidoreductase [Acidimicrobiia bacterium]